MRTLFATLAFFAFSASAFAGDWTIDAGHSEVGFSVKHLMVSKVRGKFTKFTGTIDMNESNLAKSSVKVEIDTTSIDTGDEKRDGHLKSADFFDAAKHPKMSFTSKKIKKVGRGKFKVKGELTLHGVTKPVTLTVTNFSKAVKDPWGNTKRGFSATASINRKDFGLTWNKALETGGVVVGEKVNIELEIELTKAKPAKAS